MSTLRPLPHRPNLEYVRKQAKSLLRQLRSGDRDALERAHARHPQLRATEPVQLQLSDAQLVIAREYGFTSWPRLAHYFDDLERQQHAHTQLHGGREGVEAEARAVLAQHAGHSRWAGRALAAYVPQFYGLGIDDVLARSITEDDARLAVARMHGAPSWTVLLERLDGNARTQPGKWEADPIRAAADAIGSGDVDALARVVALHPELLQPSEFDLSTGRTLMGLALGAERRNGSAALQPIVEWLTAHGFDRQRELNARLCGHISMTAEEVRALLDQGADPNWVAPNGIPVLEHALLRYWNGTAVDVLAAGTTPRRALWIAAGLGDVAGVRGFLDRDGNPTTSARRLRPDFIAVGARGFMPALPEAEDEEILLEAMIVAMLNGRTNVLAFMATRGAPVNSTIFGSALVHIAVGNGMAEVVECLVGCGADLDQPGSPSNMTTRELARSMFEQAPQNMDRRRIAVLCGVNIDEVLSAPGSAPAFDPMLEQALVLANDDAVRRGQQNIDPVNLLVGLLRAGGPPFYVLKEAAGLHADRFHAELGERVDAGTDITTQPELPMDPAAQAAVAAAIAFATSRRHEEVYGLHLLHALTREEGGLVDRLLRRCGVNATKLATQLEEGGA